MKRSLYWFPTTVRERIVREIKTVFGKPQDQAEQTLKRLGYIQKTELLPNYNEWEKRVMEEKGCHQRPGSRSSYCRSAVEVMLPTVSTTPDREWVTYFGFKRGEPISVEEIQSRFRKMSLKLHPNKGGTAEGYRRHVNMRDAAVEYVKSSAAVSDKHASVKHVSAMVTLRAGYEVDGGVSVERYERIGLNTTHNLTYDYGGIEGFTAEYKDGVQTRVLSKKDAEQFRYWKGVRSDLVKLWKDNKWM